MYRGERHFEPSEFGNATRPRNPVRGRSSGRSSGRAGRIAVSCTITLLAAWAGVATIYILFRDDALKLIADRQVSITRAYEAQIAQLNSEIDRLRSLKLIDQERVERAVADLARRQTILETRQSAITALGAIKAIAHDGGPETTGSLPASRMTPAANPAPKPTPLSDTILIAPKSQDHAWLESRPLPPLGPKFDAAGAGTPTEVRLANLASNLERLQFEQSRALNLIEEAFDLRERRMRKVFSELGLSPSRGVARLAENHSSAGASGGPFLPWTRPPADPFAQQLHRIRTAAHSIRALEREIATIPLRRPTDGRTDVTSGFGMRLDPFIRQLALHTGVDFRGEPGDPVRAAAAGKVMQAGRNGGYGLMVEIDHGNGLATRYAHMSSITTTEGAIVPAGAIIGRVGSTGRSTGPHLHYEIRADGDPLDPQRFLRAGLRLEGTY